MNKMSSDNNTTLPHESIRSSKGLTSRETSLDIDDKKDNPLFIIKKSPKKTKPNTYKVEQSSVLQRAKMFLPQMAKAQADLKTKLETQSSEDFDVECINDCDQVIEMDIALVPGSSFNEQWTSSEDGESDDEDSKISGLNEALYGPVTEQNIKMPGPKQTADHHPGIEEIPK